MFGNLVSCCRDPLTRAQGYQVGEVVYWTKSDLKNYPIGVIQYIGHVDGMESDSLWFGIDLMVSLIVLEIIIF